MLKVVCKSLLLNSIELRMEEFNIHLNSIELRMEEFNILLNSIELRR